jgi:hypothetical protein
MLAWNSLSQPPKWLGLQPPAPDLVFGGVFLPSVTQIHSWRKPNNGRALTRVPAKPVLSQQMEDGSLARKNAFKQFLHEIPKKELLMP